jgi:hypothetical protein
MSGPLDTPAPFSRDEALMIQEMVASPDAPLICPKCKQELTIGSPITMRGHTVHQLSCPECHRYFMARDMPDRSEND